MMPILLEMFRAGLIAPAATSVRDQEDSIADLLCSFAEKLDVEVQSGNFVWADVEYGSDITQTVTDALQANLVQDVTKEARRGVWVHHDMVILELGQYAGPGATCQQLEQARRGLARVMTAHPFQGGTLAAKTITALIQTKHIPIGGVSGAGLLITLPEWKT